jgi:hypothetical protein
MISFSKKICSFLRQLMIRMMDPSDSEAGEHTGSGSCQKVPKSGLGVLDEPYSAKPAQRSSHTGPPGLHRMDTVPAYVGWRACTTTPMSWLS